MTLLLSRPTAARATISYQCIILYWRYTTIFQICVYTFQLTKTFLIEERRSTIVFFKCLRTNVFHIIFVLRLFLVTDILVIYVDKISQNSIDKNKNDYWGHRMSFRCANIIIFVIINVLYNRILLNFRYTNSE